LHPAIDDAVIHLDATLGQELFHVTVGKTKPQIPSHRQSDHLRRKPEPGERCRRDGRATQRAARMHQTWLPLLPSPDATAPSWASGRRTSPRFSASPWLMPPHGGSRNLTAV